MSSVVCIYMLADLKLSPRGDVNVEGRQGRRMYLNTRVFWSCLVTGAVFEQGTTQTQTAFKYALAVRNGPEEQRRGDVEFQAFVNVINTADAFKLSRISE